MYVALQLMHARRRALLPPKAQTAQSALQLLNVATRRGRLFRQAIKPRPAHPVAQVKSNSAYRKKRLPLMRQPLFFVFTDQSLT